MWEKGNPCVLSVGMHTGTTTMENSMELPQKINIGMPVDPAILLLGIYPKNAKTLIQKNTCTSMIIIYNSQDLEVAQVPVSR